MSNPEHIPLMEMPYFLIWYLYHYWDHLHPSEITLGSCLTLSTLFSDVEATAMKFWIHKRTVTKKWEGGAEPMKFWNGCLSPRKRKGEKKNPKNPAISPVVDISGMINLLYFNCSGKTILSMLTFSCVWFKAIAIYIHLICISGCIIHLICISGCII